MVRARTSRSIEILAVCLSLAACGGGGGGGSSSPPPPTPPPTQNPPPSTPQLPDPATAPALKDEFAGFFRIGAAIEPEQLDVASDRALLLKHYSNLTPENAMKADTIAPLAPSAGNPYRFERAERIVEFATTNSMQVHGHALVWHQTTPDWFLDRPAGISDADYRLIIEQRLRAYITAVVGHFEGRVAAWDVVNEVASDNAQEVYRNSQWYQAFSVGGGDGQEYIRIAFEAARDADPNARLFINDYSTENPEKLDKILQIVDYIELGGVSVDGVGHQFHLQRTSSAEDVDAALTTVANRGKANRVTELDISIYADPGECFSNGVGCQADYGTDFANIPQSAVSQQARLYRALFDVFEDHLGSLDAVTTWGVHDAHTWLNSWPVNRTNRPLLFDRDRNPKLAFWAVVDPAFTIP